MKIDLTQAEIESAIKYHLIKKGGMNRRYVPGEIEFDIADKRDAGREPDDQINATVHMIDRGEIERDSDYPNIKL